MPVVMASVCPKCGETVVDQARFCHACGRPVAEVVRPVPVARPIPAPAPISSFYEMPVYAPVWRRAIASIIDVAVLMMVVLPGVIALFWLVEVVTGLAGMHADDGRELAGIAAVLLAVIGDWLYHAMMQSSTRQGTLGKQFMGLKVTDLDGERIGFGQASGRHFAKFLSTFALLGGFIAAAFTRRKQTLHDIVAATVVVRR